MSLPDEPVPAELDTLITALPKVELHVHLEGSMRSDLMLDLIAKHQIRGLPDSPEALRDWFAFRDFPHFIDVFNAVVHTLRDEDDFVQLVQQTAASMAAQHVRYAEVIVTPYLHTRRGVPARAVFDGLEQGRRLAEREHGVVLRWLADFPGHLGIEAGKATVDAVLDAGLDSVIGLSVGGIEVERGQFAGIFGKATAAGLHSVPHAGETHGADRVWSAVRELNAERIGHGIRCLDDDLLVAHLRDTRLPLDVCPTSNRCTGAVTAGQTHPLPALLDAGLVVTLNSDDPTMFGTTLTEEYRQAHRMGLGADDLIQLARNGVHASFLPESGKAELLTEIDTLVR